MLGASLQEKDSEKEGELLPPGAMARTFTIAIDPYPGLQR